MEEVHRSEDGRPERDARGWVILRPAAPAPREGTLWERHDDPEESR